MNLNGHLGRRMDLFSTVKPHPQVLFVQSNGYTSTERRKTLNIENFTWTDI